MKDFTVSVELGIFLNRDQFKQKFIFSIQYQLFEIVLKQINNYSQLLYHLHSTTILLYYYQNHVLQVLLPVQVITMGNWLKACHWFCNT